jgi:hypothetical protein
VQTRLTARLWASDESFAAKRGNLTALKRAAELVGREGGGLHVFPSGSTQTTEWRPGLGAIVSSLASIVREVGTSVFLVPVVYEVRHVHLVASKLFPAYSAARWFGHARVWVSAGPPSVFVGRPLALADLGIDESTSAREVTNVIRDLWLGAAADAKRSMPRWSVFRRADLRPGAR